MKANYSVVHNGPIAYFQKLWQALSHARKVIRSRGFTLDGEVTRLNHGDTITVYGLDDSPGTDVVQSFTVQ